MDTKWLSEDEQREFLSMAPATFSTKRELLSRLAAEREKTVKLDELLKKLTVKYQALVRWFDDHEGTPCEQIRHQHEIERLQDEIAKLKESGNAK